jgi:hypothetical protein
MFPEVIDGPCTNAMVTDTELTVTVRVTESDYNTDLLEEHLRTFLEEQAG